MSWFRQTTTAAQVLQDAGIKLSSVYTSGGLRPREHVVVERLCEDRRVDQTDDVLARAQASGIDHGLQPRHLQRRPGQPSRRSGYAAWPE